jgi:hypothetical protein
MLAMTLAVSSAGAAHAQEQGAEPESQPLDVDALAALQRRPRAEVTLGIWFPRLEGQITLGEGGTELDAGDDLSLDDSDTIFNGEFQIEWDRWQVLVGGYVVDTGGDTVMTRDAIVRGSLVTAGTAVSSRVRAWSIDAEASWAIFTPFRERRMPWSDRRAVEPSPIDLVVQAVGGLRVVNLDQQYDFETLAPIESDRAWFIPWLGVGCEIDWSTRYSLGVLDRIVFDMTAGWGPAISGGNSSFTVRADMTTYITRNVGITLGYRLNDWDLARDGDTFDGGLQGLYAGVRLAW